MIPIVTGTLETVLKRLKKRTNRGHPDSVIVEIGQNTEKSSGDLRGLAVPRTTVKDY